MARAELRRGVLLLLATVALVGDAFAGEPATEEPDTAGAIPATPRAELLPAIVPEACPRAVTLLQVPELDGADSGARDELSTVEGASRSSARADLEVAVPLSVLLTREPSRGSFKLVEMGVHDLRRGAQAIRDARDRYELEHIDYERILERIEALARDIERTFRPDLEPGAPFYPDVGEVLIDEGLWRIGAPTP